MSAHTWPATSSASIRRHAGALILALAGSGAALAQLPPGTPPAKQGSAPIYAFPFLDLTATFQQLQLEVSASVGATESLASELLQGFASCDPRTVWQLNAAIAHEAFGATFVPYVSALWAPAPAGAFDPSAFSTIFNESGAGAGLADFTVIPLPSIPAELLDPAGTPYVGAEALVYSARIGSSPRHAGLAFRVADGSGGGVLALLPLLTAPRGSAVKSGDLAAFLALALETPDDVEIDLIGWLKGSLQGKGLSEDGGDDGEPGTIHWWDVEPCDEEALAACLAGATAAYGGAVNQAESEYESKVNARLNEYRKTIKSNVLGVGAAGLLTGAWAGAKLGAAAGSAAGPIGIAIGIAAGALGGAAVGSAGALLKVSLTDEVQQDLDHYREELNQKLCAAFFGAQAAIQGCFDAHCPIYSSEVTAWLAALGLDSNCF